jgi:FkbM family methyltransferase
MLIPFADVLLKYKFIPKGVVHAGAHWAEEHGDYVKAGIRNIAYIEPCKEAFSKMVVGLSGVDARDIGDGVRITSIVEKMNIICYNVACGDTEGTMAMHISHNNQGQSNSLLEPNLHLQQHPEVVFTDAEAVRVVKLDNLSLNKKCFDLLVMDVQGYELQVLKGATETLKHIKMIYSEINRGSTYMGNALVEELDEFLKPFGFTRVETFWPSPNWTWGDAVYVHESML